jgi:cytoskeleton protein RodZ
MPAVADAAGPPDDPAPDDPAPELEPAAELEPAVAGEALRVDLIFVGDSWVEVTDADGQRLVFGLMRAGRTDSVLGMPPVEVLLGSADAVRLEVNGRPLDIAPGDVRGGVARLTISGP